MSENRKKLGRPKAVLQSMLIDLPPSAEDATGGWRLDLAGIKPIEAGHVALFLKVGLSDKSRQLLQVGASVEMLLRLNGVIGMDVEVSDIAGRFDRTIPAGKVEVMFKRAENPAKRIDAERRDKISRVLRQRNADRRASAA